jgi:DNA polymerase III epsilon subunit-like protein
MDDPLTQAIALLDSASAFCVFDTETTDKLTGRHGPGLRHAPGTPTGKIMQLAARRYHRDGDRYRLVGELNALINDPDILPGPDRSAPGGAGCCLVPGAYETHRISIDDLRRFGQPPNKVYTAFLRLVDGAALVGHNIIEFDIPFVNRELNRFGFRFALNPGRAIDTLPISRQLLSLPSYRLRSVASHLDVRTDETKDHDAAADIETVWQVWLALEDVVRAYRAKFFVGKPDQYKRAIGSLGRAWLE